MTGKKKHHTGTLAETAKGPGCRFKVPKVTFFSNIFAFLIWRGDLNICGLHQMENCQFDGASGMLEQFFCMLFMTTEINHIQTIRELESESDWVVLLDKWRK